MPGGREITESSVGSPGINRLNKFATSAVEFDGIGSLCGSDGRSPVKIESMTVLGDPRPEAGPVDEAG